MTDDRVLVVTSCTSRKLGAARTQSVRAEDLYVGEQHRRLMRGVRAFRTGRSGLDLDLRVVSAGLGLLRGDEMVESYDRAFSGLNASDLDAQADALAVPQAVRGLFEQPHRLALVLLGADYLRVSRLLDMGRYRAPTLFFCGEVVARRLQAKPNAVVVPAGRHEAREFSCGLVGLKGELGGRVLTTLSTRPDLVEALQRGEVPDLLRPLPETSNYQIGMAA